MSAYPGLATALSAEERKCITAIDELRDLAPDHHVDQVYDLTRELRLAVDLVGCLRRLLVAATPDDLHRAFGAPGDFGYATPIGAALDRIYRAGSDPTICPRCAELETECSRLQARNEELLHLAADPDRPVAVVVPAGQRELAAAWTAGAHAALAATAALQWCGTDVTDAILSANPYQETTR